MNLLSVRRGVGRSPVAPTPGLRPSILDLGGEEGEHAARSGCRRRLRLITGGSDRRTVTRRCVGAAHRLAAVDKHVLLPRFVGQEVALLFENELGLFELQLLQALQPLVLALELQLARALRLLLLALSHALRFLLLELAHALRFLLGEELRLLLGDLRLLLGELRSDKQPAVALIPTVRWN